MMFDMSVALNWILFIALFPITYFWSRAAYKILIKRDVSDVALKHGEPPENQAKFAPFSAVVNLVGAGILGWVIFGIIFAGMPFDSWTAVAGSTIWMKMILDFLLRRHAHFKVKPRKGAEQPPNDTGDIKDPRA
ncbi:MAG: hypothetical protein ACO38B_05020 [Burkholderiaceae bacterium]